MEIRNEGTQTIRYRAEDIVLRVGSEEYEAIDVSRVVADADPGLEEARIAKTEGIRGATLAPGDIDDGFVFFRKKIPQDEAPEGGVEVAIHLYDADHATLLETIPIPMVVVGEDPQPAGETRSGAY